MQGEEIANFHFPHNYVDIIDVVTSSLNYRNTKHGKTS
jgi:hypothetical protein